MMVKLMMKVKMKTKRRRKGVKGEEDMGTTIRKKEGQQEHKISVVLV